MNRIEGLIAAVYTPFGDDGLLNLSAIPRYAEHLKRCGVAGVFVNGTTGEGTSLTEEERKQCAEAWTQQSEAHFRVIIHVGHNSIEVAKQLAAHAQMIEADGFGAMAPTFLKPATLHDLVAYNTAIAHAAPSLPFYYYHIPALTGVRYPMVDYLPIAEKRIPNMAGIKYTDEDLMDMKLCLEYADGKYDVLHGRDEILTCGLVLGVQGAIGSTYNYIAPLFNRIIRRYGEGNVKEADRLQLIAIKLISILHQFGGALKSGKYFMRLLGIDLGVPRMPIGELTTQEVKELEQMLDKMDFLSHTRPARDLT